jgi:hypothetical protein
MSLKIQDVTVTKQCPKIKTADVSVTDSVLKRYEMLMKALI